MKPTNYPIDFPMSNPSATVQRYIGSAGIYGDFDVQYVRHCVSYFSELDAFDETDMTFVYEEWYIEFDVSSYCAAKPGDPLCSAKRGPSLPVMPYSFSAAFEMAGDRFPGLESRQAITRATAGAWCGAFWTELVGGAA